MKISIFNLRFRSSFLFTLVLSLLFCFSSAQSVRVFQDNSGGVIRDPESKPEAKILVDNPRRTFSKLDLNDENGFISITTGKIRVQLDKKTTLLKVINLKTNAP